MDVLRVFPEVIQRSFKKIFMVFQKVLCCMALFLNCCYLMLEYLFWVVVEPLCFSSVSFFFICVYFLFVLLSVFSCNSCSRSPPNLSLCPFVCPFVACNVA